MLKLNVHNLDGCNNKLLDETKNIIFLFDKMRVR